MFNEVKKKLHRAFHGKDLIRTKISNKSFTENLQQKKILSATQDCVCVGTPSTLLQVAMAPKRLNSQLMCC